MAANRHSVNVLVSNSTFLIFAVLVVWCRPCRHYRLFYTLNFESLCKPFESCAWTRVGLPSLDCICKRFGDFVRAMWVEIALIIVNFTPYKNSLISLFSDAICYKGNEVVDIRHRVWRHLATFSLRMRINGYLEVLVKTDPATRSGDPISYNRGITLLLKYISQWFVDFFCVHVWKHLVYKLPSPSCSAMWLAVNRHTFTAHVHKRLF